MCWEERLSEGEDMADIIEEVNMALLDLRNDVEEKEQELEDAKEALANFEEDNKEILMS